MESPKEKAKREAIEAVKNHPDLTYQEIAVLCSSDEYTVKLHQVCLWAKEEGHSRRPRRQGTAKAVEGHEEDLDTKIRQLEQQLAEARQQKAATEIRFDRDGSNVVVYGLGAQPLVADHRDWSRFLRKSGVALLRQFINENFPSVQ